MDKREGLIIGILFFVIFISIAYNISRITGAATTMYKTQQYIIIDGKNFSVGSRCIINITRCDELVRMTYKMPRDQDYIFSSVRRIAGGFACGKLKIREEEEKTCMKFDLFNGTGKDEQSLLKKEEPKKEIVKEKVIPLCVDSDNGENENIYGEVLLRKIFGDKIDETSGVKFKDRCIDDKHVEENYCSSTTSVISIKKCSSDRACKNGACVLSSSLNIIDEEDEEYLTNKRTKIIITNGLIILV